MLKITADVRNPRHRVLRLDGQLVGPWVDELSTACTRALAEDDARLTLDLAGVGYVEPAAVQLLRRLRARRVELAQCPPFVAVQLESTL